jgi:hypothetical protein
MQRLWVFLIVTGMVFASMSPALAQSGSTGCLTIDGSSGTANPTFTLGTQTFTQGDRVEVSVTGSGDNFILEESGSQVAGPAAVGTTLVYIIPADGDYTFSVTVDANFDGTTTAKLACTGAASIDDDDGDGEKVTICHRPPGNPAAAHTITVGGPALEAHLGHGDSIGACPPSLQTRLDVYEANLAIFTLKDAQRIELWGNCTANCSLVLIIDIEELELNSIDIEEETYIDGEPDDGWHAIVYYLHDDPNDEDVAVYQINIYEDDVLVSDSMLVFIGPVGEIVRWATHSYWFAAFAN